MFFPQTSSSHPPPKAPPLWDRAFLSSLGAGLPGIKAVVITWSGSPQIFYVVDPHKHKGNKEKHTNIHKPRNSCTICILLGAISVLRKMMTFDLGVYRTLINTMHRFVRPSQPLHTSRDNVTLRTLLSEEFHLCCDELRRHLLGISTCTSWGRHGPRHVVWHFFNGEYGKNNMRAGEVRRLPGRSIANLGSVLSECLWTCPFVPILLFLSTILSNMWCLYLRWVQRCIAVGLKDVECHECVSFDVLCFKCCPKSSHKYPGISKNSQYGTATGTACCGGSVKIKTKELIPDSKAAAEKVLSYLTIPVSPRPSCRGACTRSIFINVHFKEFSSNFAGGAGRNYNEHLP